MNATNTTIVHGLRSRITSAVLNTFEMGQFRESIGAKVLKLVYFSVPATLLTSGDRFTFDCILTLEADPGLDKKKFDSYEVMVAGEIIFNSPAWDLGQLFQIAPTAQQTRW